jgi:hypothetical protein
MQTLITINGKTGAQNQSVYSQADLRKMARALVGKRGKPFAMTVQFDEMTGRARLIVSFETEPNKQTFESIAI